MSQAKKRRLDEPTTSDRLKAVALDALTAENAKSALSTKLLAMGLALVCLAGGIDYFSHEEKFKAAITGYALDSGHTGVASAIETTDRTIKSWKASLVETIPQPYRDHLAGATLALGVISIGAGLRMKVRAAGPARGKVVRDVGRVLAGPGVIGAFVFAALSWREALVLRSATASFVRKLLAGAFTSEELGQLTRHYGGWTYEEVGGVLWISAGALAVWIALLAFELRLRPRRPLALEVGRRTVGWIATLTMVYLLVATTVAVTSYGGALRVVAWPWKIDPGAFLVALGFMSLGFGLARTGTKMFEREEAEKTPKKSNGD